MVYGVYNSDFSDSYLERKLSSALSLILSILEFIIMMSFITIVAVCMGIALLVAFVFVVIGFEISALAKMIRKKLK